MNRIFQSLLLGPYVVMSLVFLLPASLAQAEERPGELDIKTLKGQIVQLKARLDQNPGDYEALQGIGIAYHDLAITDSKAYAQKAVQYLEKACQNKPDNNIILCYLGSAYTLLAKEVGDRSKQANYVNKGFEDMDKAVRKDPDNIAIRMVRGNNSRALPRFLNRRPIAYEDFEHLAGLFEKGVQVPPQLKSSVYRILAGLYQEDGNVAKAQELEARAKTP
jgi:hypothetical protein